MGEMGVPSEPHSPCTGLLCLFANKPLKTWPRDSWSQGTPGSRSSSSSGAVGLQHPLRARGHHPHSDPPPSSPGTCPCLGTPCFRPSLFPVREHARGLGRINTEEEEAGPPQPCPSSLRNKRKPLSTPRPEMGWGWRLFRCFSGWNKLVVGELGATSWLPSQPAGLPSPALAEFFHPKGQPPYPEP